METGQDPKQPFRDSLREIVCLVLGHTINNMPDPSKKPSPGDWRAFFRRVWADWKLAQVRVTEELVRVHTQRALLKRLERAIRENHDQALISRLRVARMNLDHEENTLRSIANSMVWMMFNNRRWIVRRLKVDGSATPVNSIGSETTLFVDAVNERPDAMALMADITSCVGIGDVVMMDLRVSPEPQVVELKGGATNERVVSLVEEHGMDLGALPPSVLEDISYEIGPNGQKHFERVARQKARADNFESFVNHDFGIDQETGYHARNLGPARGVHTYDELLQATMLDASRKGRAVACVEGCVWIGVYRSGAIHSGLREDLLREVADRGGSILCRVWSLQSVCFDPRLQPLFLRSIDTDLMLDIVLGEAVVLIYVDWDTFFQQARDIGVNARWTTPEERKKIIADFYHERAFRDDGHVPVMEKDGRAFTSMGGHVGRIINEGLSPQCLLGMIRSTFDTQDAPEENTEAESQFRVSWVNSRKPTASEAE